MLPRAFVPPGIAGFSLELMTVATGATGECAGIHGGVRWLDARGEAAARDRGWQR